MVAISRQTVTVLALTATLLVSGCAGLTDKVSSGFGLWAKDTGDQPAPLVDFKPAAVARLVWQEKVAASGENVFSPTLAGDGLAAVGQDGKIARIGEGRLLWRTEGGRQISGGVGASDKLVLVGTPKGEVLAYDAGGKLLWLARLSSEILSAPQAAEGVVVVRTGDGRIYGLDGKDGQRKWVYQRATPALTLRSHVGVTVARGVVLAGFAGGKLVAINLSNGNVGWEATVALPRGATELERIADVTSPPVVDGNQVCAVAYQGRVACFDLRSGNQLWAREISSIAGLTVEDRYLYVSDAKGAVHALDKTSGGSLWKQDKLFARRLSAPRAIGRYVAVADYQGFVHFLAREDGSFAARIATDGSAVIAAPLILNGNLVVQTLSGGLFALSVQ